MKLNTLLVLSLVLGLTSCNKIQTLEEKQAEIQNGALDASNRYTAAEIGWSADVPANWRVMSKEEKEGINGQGKKGMEAAMGGEIDTSGQKELLNLRKDKFNSFLSTMAPYNEAKDGSWKEAQANIVPLVEKTYANAGIKTGKTIQGTEEIDGLEFLTTQFTILHPSTGGVLMTQKLYSRLINGFDYGVTVSYNNAEDQAAMEKIVQSSKFSLRD